MIVYSNDNGLVEVVGKRLWIYLIVEPTGFADRFKVQIRERGQGL